jgi:hypothetical protein
VMDYTELITLIIIITNDLPLAPSLATTKETAAASPIRRRNGHTSRRYDTIHQSINQSSPSAPLLPLNSRSTK